MIYKLLVHSYTLFNGVCINDSLLLLTPCALKHIYAISISFILPSQLHIYDAIPTSYLVILTAYLCHPNFISMPSNLHIYAIQSSYLCHPNIIRPRYSVNFQSQQSLQTFPVICDMGKIQSRGIIASPGKLGVPIVVTSGNVYIMALDMIVGRNAEGAGQNLLGTEAGFW